MTTFTETEAEKKFATVLDRAVADGQEFILRPTRTSGLDVGVVKIDSPRTIDEIVKAVREGRERD